jgi:hypothetical protein
MKKYLAYGKSYRFNFPEWSVQEFEVTKETPKMVCFADQSGIEIRILKKCRGACSFSDFRNFYKVCDSREEAFDTLISELSERESEKLQKADLLTREAREIAGRIEELRRER